MARKGILGSSLTAAMAKSLEEEEADLIAARSGDGRSNPATELAKLSVREEHKHSVRVISTNRVRLSRISDRIDPEDGLDSLIESIQEGGQRVPILVRPVSDTDYEVVYGRRRLLACRALGIDVRASVMEMSDEEALIAQGVENNERLNTSFIERALFAHRLEQEGVSPGVIQKIIGVHETLVRKMRAIAAAIPEPLIVRIGPAPDSGRRQWDELRRLCASMPEDDLVRLTEGVDSELPSSDRLTETVLIASGVPRDLIRAITSVAAAPKLSWTDLITLCRDIGPERAAQIATEVDRRRPAPKRMRQALLVGSGIPVPLIDRIGLDPDPGEHLWDKLRTLCAEIGPARAAELATEIREELPPPSRVRQALLVGSGIPSPLVVRVGFDPDPGDHLWNRLREAWEQLADEERDALSDLPPVDKKLDSHERLLELLKAMNSGSAGSREKHPRPVEPEAGCVTKRTTKRLVVEAQDPKDRTFLSYLEANLSKIYEEWRSVKK